MAWPRCRTMGPRSSTVARPRGVSPSSGVCGLEGCYDVGTVDRCGRAARWRGGRVDLETTFDRSVGRVAGKFDIDPKCPGYSVDSENARDVHHLPGDQEQSEVPRAGLLVRGLSGEFAASFCKGTSRSRA